MTGQDLAPLPQQLAPDTMFELDQRRAKAYAESGYWPDAKSIAQALVKIEAGRSLGLPPIVAMGEVHVIDGRPSLGAGALSALVKASGRYDYRVTELTNERCALRFYDRGEMLQPASVFTIEDAQRAGLMGRGPWKQYPRNMLFARAMSNGVAWHCPDVTSGRVYIPDELLDLAEAELVELTDEELAAGAVDPVSGDEVPDLAAGDDDELIEWPDPSEQPA